MRSLLCRRHTVINCWITQDFVLFSNIKYEFLHFKLNKPPQQPHCRNHLVQALISSHLDYCCSLLCGFIENIQLKSLSRLRLVQNAAAWFLTGSNRQCRFSPILASLHWLPLSSDYSKSSLGACPRLYTGGKKRCADPLWACLQL